MREPGRALRRIVATAVMLSVTGCGYIWTYDQAFPPRPLDFPRWDPPDSLAFRAPEPPPVESVIMDAEFWYLIHPQGEQEYMRALEREARAREARARARNRARETTPADSVFAVADSIASDSLVASVDSAAVPDSAAVVPALPPVQIDLTPREEDTLIRRAQVDLDIAETMLRILEAEPPPTRTIGEQIQAVHGLVRQSRAAMARRDLRGAANLALKARSLAQDLYEGGSRPR